jgi:hypothetical protein
MGKTCLRLDPSTASPIRSVTAVMIFGAAR